MHNDSQQTEESVTLTKGQADNAAHAVAALVAISRLGRERGIEWIVGLAGNALSVGELPPAAASALSQPSFSEDEKAEAGAFLTDLAAVRGASRFLRALHEGATASHHQAQAWADSLDRLVPFSSTANETCPDCGDTGCAWHAIDLDDRAGATAWERLLEDLERDPQRTEPWCLPDWDDIPLEHRMGFVHSLLDPSTAPRRADA